MNWYVLHTKPRHEKKVEEELISFVINAYFPRRKKIKSWTDRKKKIEIAALPSMVLVKINEKDINKVFQSIGVIRYMFFDGKRAVVKDEEVKMLKNYLNGINEFSVIENSKYKIGDDLNLSNLNNEKGTVTKISNNKIWVYLKSLCLSVKLELA